jgi:hypothetical protein
MYAQISNDTDLTGMIIKATRLRGIKVVPFRRENTLGLSLDFVKKFQPT